MIPLPSPPRIIEKNDKTAKFVIEGLYPGYGVTIGNALRRVLFSSLKGAAASNVKIKGVQHEFSTIPGVMEDVIRICLNLKKLRFKVFSDEPVKVALNVKGTKEVTGKDFKLSPELELINKDQHIATLTNRKANLEMEIIVRKGVGYEPKEMRIKEKLAIGDIPLDAIFTPAKRVSYRVENMRVGERTDFDRLYVEIETDGTILPEDALAEAVKLLIDHFALIHEQAKKFQKSAKTERVETKKAAKPKRAKAKKKGAEITKLSVEAIKLSKRTLGAVLNAHIKTVGGLLRKKEADILAIEGLGEKGLKEIKKALKKSGLELKKD